jgi:energy-coupling factor transport system permease protein
MKFVKELAPFTKFIIMLSIIGCAYSTDSVPAMAVFIVMQAVVAMVSGAGRTYLKIFLALFAGAITLTLFQIFYIKDGNVVFTIIPPLDWGKVTDQGLYESLVLSVRMIASIGSIPLMIALTPATQIVSLISGTFRLSPAYTCMLVTALRFIPTFRERMRMVLQAEASRGYRADTANPFRKIGMVLRLSLPLLVTCVRDVDSLALSLEARGFTPDSKARPQHIPMKAAEHVMVLASLLALTLFIAARFL